MSEKNSKQKKLLPEELYAFSDEMGMMIEGGVSALEGVTLMMEEASSEKDRELLKDMHDVISETSSFATAVKHTGVFPEYYNEMITIGEQTGKTDSTLIALSNHYEREHNIKKAIRSAIGYPILMVSMMFAIIIVLVTQIMPIFERVFEQLGSNMEGVSGGLLSVGKFLGRYAVLIFVILVFIIGMIVYLSKNLKGRKFLMNIFYHFKTFRNIFDKLAASRFASGMAMTLSSGMDIMQAIEVSARLVDNTRLDEKIEKLKETFMNTMDLGKAFQTSGIFSGIYGRMVVLANRTGRVEQAMEKIADTYQTEADDEINGLISVVEPTLVILMSVVVGMILLSVMLPLLSIMAGLN